jgi:hypothetical protein
MIELGYVQHKATESGIPNLVHIQLPRLSLHAASGRFRHIDDPRGTVMSIRTFTGQDQIALEMSLYHGDLDGVLLHFADWLHTGRAPLSRTICSWDLWHFGHVIEAPMYQDDIIRTMLREARRNDNPAGVILGKPGEEAKYLRHSWKTSGFGVQRGLAPNKWIDKWTDKQFLRLLLDTVIWMGPYEPCVEEMLAGGGHIAVFLTRSMVEVTVQGKETNKPWEERRAWKYCVQNLDDGGWMESMRARENERGDDLLRDRFNRVTI